MSHYIYNTDGIILGGYDVEESSRFLKILTKDLGLLGVKAQGLRELKSKLRYSLQDFSYSQINLVRGRDVWRIISASKKDSYDNLFSSKEKLQTFADILHFVKRLIRGEEKGREIFDFILNTLYFLEKENLSKDQLESVALISKIKILYHLGYLDPKKVFSFFVGFSVWTMEVVDDFIGLKKEAQDTIESSLRESHL